MIESVYALIFVLGSFMTYLSLYRTDRQVQVPIVIGLACWSILVLAGGEIVVGTQGPQANPLAQYLALFLATVHAFALTGAIFGYYPTDQMFYDTNKRQERQ